MVSKLLIRICKEFKSLRVVLANVVILLLPGYSLRAEEGLLVRYAFQEGSGNVLRDSSGGGHDGVIEGEAKWVKAKAISALDLNGGNTHVVGPSDLAIGRVGTLEIWCYPRAVGGGLISWHLGPQWVDQRLVFGFSTYANSNTLLGALSDGKLSETIQEPFPTDALNRWSHMVLRFDDRNLQFFRNGKLFTSKARFLFPDIEGVPMRIGTVVGQGAGYFNGMIAEASVYSRALSVKEILAHFQEKAAIFQPDSDAAKAIAVARRPAAARKQSGTQMKIIPPDKAAAHKQPIKLQSAERIEIMKGGGYFPIMIKLNNGTLAAVVRAGARHIGAGGRLDLITSRDGGKTWSPPRILVYMPPDSRSGAFGQAADGRLIYTFSVTGPYRGGQMVLETERYTLWMTTSDDNGETWTPPRQIKTDPYDWSMPYGKIVAMPDGMLLMPLYGWWKPEHEGEKLPDEKEGYFAAVSRSEDNGLSWGLPIPIVGYIPGRRANTNYNEYSLVALPDGKVLAIMRGGPLDGLDQCISSDGGLTWGPIESIVPDQSRQPGDVIQLKSGRLLLTFGHREPPFGAEAVLSHNEPGQWDHLAVPAENPRPQIPSNTAQQWDWQTHVALEWNAASADCGYPSSVQLDDGTIVTMYYGVGEIGKSELSPIEPEHRLPLEYAKVVRYQEADLLNAGK